MNNPYWSSDGQRHYIDLESIRLLCFELLCLFEASKSLAQESDLIEADDEDKVMESAMTLFRLHQKYAFIQTSKALLQLAVWVRTYDDQMRESDKAEEYVRHIEANDDGHYVGTLLGKEKFTSREACNKIIHAREIRPLYERIERGIADMECDGKGGQDIWYLTGEIELSGTHFGTDWQAVVYLQPFMEVILSIVEFGYPQGNDLSLTGY